MADIAVKNKAIRAITAAAIVAQAAVSIPAFCHRSA
jgi:hypothetical protein